MQQHRDRLGEPVSGSADTSLADSRFGLDPSDDEWEVLLLRRAQLELDEVLAALQRVERGVYGTCAACEEAIELHRLRVRPEARLCATCQNSLERRSTVRTCSG